MRSPISDGGGRSDAPGPHAVLGTGRAHRRRTIRTADLGACESVLSGAYLPLKLRPTDRGEVNSSLVAVGLGATTVGSVELGAEMQIDTGAAVNFHVDFPVRGRSRSAAGTQRELDIAPGTGQVFNPGAPADLLWSRDARMVCVMLDKTETERRLATMLGRELDRPLLFDARFDLQGPAGALWKHVLRLVDHEMRRDAGLLAFPLTRRTVEGLVIESLLTGHSHTYSDDLHRRHADRGPGDRISAAVELIEEHPERAWTTTELAAAVGVGARSLQEGFRRRFDTSPMAYVRGVRLDRVKDELSTGDPATAVSDVARRWGFAHLGRFAADYRRRHGALPSQTLRGERRR